MVDTIKEYCENQLEFLERELTDLSLTHNNFSSRSELNDLKESYKQRLMISVELTEDLQYYINLYIESWFQTSLNRIIELHNRRGKIKEKFRLLAKEWHPDKRKDSSDQKMTEINNAYEVLSNPELREKYDKYFKLL